MKVNLSKRIRRDLWLLLAYLKHGTPLQDKTKERLIEFLEELPPAPFDFFRKLAQKHELAHLVKVAREKGVPVPEVFRLVSRGAGVPCGESSVRDAYYEVRRLEDSLTKYPLVEIPPGISGPSIFIDKDPPIWVTTDAVFSIDEAGQIEELRKPNASELEMLAFITGFSTEE